MGAKGLSPLYVIRIFREFGFTDEEIENILKQFKMLGFEKTYIKIKREQGGVKGEASIYSINTKK